MFNVYLLAWVLQTFIAQSSIPAPPRPAPKGMISGTVIDAVSGAGVKNARVIASNGESDDEPYGAITDANGHFAMVGLSPGQYELSADRVGYARGSYGSAEHQRISALITLGSGQALDGIVIRLTRAAAISGRIVDKDGDPVPNAMVTASQYNWDSGKKELQVRGLASTDDRGEYRIFSLPPGKYFLAAEIRNAPQENFQPADVVTELTKVPTYYPGTTEPETAQAIDLKSGDDLDSMDFAILGVYAVKVSGHIVDGSSGKPLEGACLDLNPRSQALGLMYSWRMTCSDGPAGDFKFTGIVPGSYTLTATFKDGPHSMSADIPVTVGEDGLNDMTIQLLPSVVLRGHLVVEGDSRASHGELSLNLVPVDMPWSNVEPVRPDANGDFKFDSVSPGSYMLRLGDPGDNIYLKSVRLGGREIPDQTITADRETANNKLEVVASTNAAQIEGVAIDDDKRLVANALVVLAPDVSRRNREDLFQNRKTDALGRFFLNGIPPGEYVLFAWSSGRSVAYRNPDWLAQYESRGSVVGVTDGTRLSVQVRTIKLDDSSQ